MITGFHQNYIGANQHRTRGPGWEKQPLPYGIRPISHLLEEAGYYTCLMENRKTDVNYTTEKELFMGKDWGERAEGQPFFAQITFSGTHRIWYRDPENPIDIEDVELPPIIRIILLRNGTGPMGLRLLRWLTGKSAGSLTALNRRALPIIHWFSLSAITVDACLVGNSFSMMEESRYSSWPGGWVRSKPGRLAQTL